MRHYTSDSTQAMARVVSLALLADGGLDNSEIQALQKHSILDKLNIDPETFDQVMHEFCNDILQSARAPNVGQIEIDREVIDHLLGDIRSPELQKEALRAMLDIVNADWSLSGGEAVLVSQAMSLWGLELHHLPPSGGRTALRPSLHIERQERPPVEGSESALHIERLTLLLNSSASDGHPAPGSFQ
ncbi:MAG: TerB family tellurite resistance protein [Candidatus Accumulibacter phosphatis]|uniref:TerB family tellurite resistance protein n=1 Tax=Candidatus Accumulibacter phosphatis TaxID=327160 RepID=UPI001A5E5BB3|nr:TerB family tellurite resistance protein [Candidatus Accumulibacter phosphatis]